MSDIPTYGVRERSVLRDDIDRYVEELQWNGFAVVPGVFAGAEMQDAAELLDKIYDIQQREAASGSLAGSNDEDIVRCPLAYAEEFLRISTHETMHGIVSRILGENYVLLMQNAVINRAKKEHYQLRWHRDLNYQHWTSSHPLALSSLVCIDRFFREGGATWFLPGSHRYERFPSNEYVTKHEVSVEAEAGSVIVFDAMTFHRSGHNSTEAFVRRAVNQVVGTPFMAQQIDIPRMLAARGLDYGDDPFLSKYLGYRWNPAPDPQTWRRSRMAPPLKAGSHN